MVRIAPVDTPDDEQAALLARSLPGPDGAPLNVFSTLVRWPELMRRVNALGGYFKLHGVLTDRQRELAILRTAGLIGCAYELAQHRWLSARAGIDANTASAASAAADATPHPWTGEEAALLAVVDEVVAADRVTDRTWARALELLGEEALVEAVVLVGFYRMLGGFLAAAEVEIDASARRVEEGPGE